MLSRNLNDAFIPSSKKLNGLSTKITVGICFCAALSLTAINSWGALSYPGCSDVTDADFKVDTLAINKKDASVKEPLKMAFDKDANGNVDVYFIQRRGLVRRYNAVAKTIDNLADFTALVLPVAPAAGDTQSDGLTGLALDPNFKTNHWVYLHFGLDREWKVFRYTLKGNTLDLATEKLLINIPTDGTTKHTAGALQFDRAGNLFIATANNYAEESPLNTNDWRGKILRIKPKPLADNTPVSGMGPGVTYDIPEGNLFPQSVAANVGKTKPEVYIMGTRNPYTLTVDPLNNAITWGDIGPDEGGPTEEMDYASTAGNGGYPYFAGNNTFRGGGGNTDPLNQTNNFAKNTGLKNLPPARPATYAYNRNASITGPVFRYGDKPNLPGKMPPHFDGMWFIGDFNSSWVKAAKLDANGKIVGTPTDIFGTIKAIHGPLDFQEGPDGQFYVASYGTAWRGFNPETGIFKISYKGPACTFTGSGIHEKDHNNFAKSGISLSSSEVTFSSLGKHSFVLKNLNGQNIVTHEGNGPSQYALNELKQPGVYILEAVTESGRFTTKLVKN